MNKDLQFNFRLLENGKLNLVNVLMVGVPIAAFVLWRALTFGVHDSDRILDAIETELMEDYKQVLYKEYGLADDERDARDAEEFPLETFQNLEVELTRVSMAVPLLSWGTHEEVIVRFDYEIQAEGEVHETGEDVYKRVSRRRGLFIWDSGPARYYMNYVL